MRTSPSEHDQTLMLWLSRICEQYLNPSCVASCPDEEMEKLLDKVRLDLERIH